MERRKQKMETLATVALRAAPNTELVIGEVCHMTGYSGWGLRRLEMQGKIPQSHRKDGIRYWYAHEVEKIIDYKKRMISEWAQRMKRVQKLGVKARAKKTRESA